MRIDDSLSSFGFDNIKPESQKKLSSGLIEEAKAKTYINNELITCSNISNFLSKVTFVIDDKTPCEYVREIIKDHPAIIPSDNDLIAIFNEIRDKQSEKKNTSVEGITIQATDEVLNHCRHLTNSEIKLLTLQRIISKNPVELSVPQSFIPIYISWPPQRQKDMFDECRQTLCRALFNKNAADAFWSLFENIYTLIMSKPSLGPEELFRMMDPAIKNATPDFDTLSLKFFISVVKDGIQGEN